MKKLSMFLALLVTILMFAFITSPPPALAEEITTTTEEQTTTTTDTEFVGPPTSLALEDEIDLALETAKNAIIAFVTSVIGVGIIGSIAKALLDKAIKAFTGKVREAEAQNKLSSERANQLVATMETLQVTANAKIDDLSAKLEDYRAENELLHGDVSALLAELKERELRIAELLEAVLGTSGETDGEE